jgi:hypothetical protein
MHPSSPTSPRRIGRIGRIMKRGCWPTRTCTGGDVPWNAVMSQA